MSVESHDLGPVPNLTQLAGYGDSYVVPGDEVYVVAEDCDYIYQNTGSNPVADGFNIIKAIFLPGVWQRRDGGAGASGLRFNTVAIGVLGSGRLIDADIVGLVDGTSTAWVESVKDSWRWDATSTLTADNITVCNPTANGVNPGRFIRKLEPAPEWLLQAAWFIDSTAASNEGAGSALDPLQSDVELNRRWGAGVRAQIRQATTITYAQSPAVNTILLFETDGASGAVKFIGTPTVSKAGTVITAVQAQVRTAGAEAAWAITGVGLGATEVGKLVFITASAVPANVGAYAPALKDEGGGQIRVDEFVTFDESTGNITARTPQVGDTIEIRDMSATTLSVAKIEASSCSLTAPGLGARVQFDSIFVDGGAANSGTVQANGLGFYYVRSVLNRLLMSGIAGQSSANHFVRGGLVGTGGIIISAGTAQISTAGALGSVIVRARASVIIAVDSYFQNCSLSVQRAAVCNTQGVAFFDRTVADSSLILDPTSQHNHTSAVADWGTANAGHGVVVRSGVCSTYATKPTINGTLGAGREALIGGTDKLYADVPYVEGANLAALVLTA